MRHKFVVAVNVLTVVILAGALQCLWCQADDLEQQLKSIYKVSTRGADSTGMKVVQAGTIVTIQQGGLLGVPSTSFVLPAAQYKKGEFHAANGLFAGNNTRFLDAGEKVYITKFSVNAKADKISFLVQECDSCNQVSGSSYQAAVNFQFDKGYLATANVKAVVDTIGKVLALDEASGQPGPRNNQQQAEPVQLKFPAIYVNSQDPSERIQFNADKSFSLQEGGNTYHGTFNANGNSVELNIAETKSTSTVTLQGNTLIDTGGAVWTLH